MSTLAVKLDPHAVDISVDEAALHFILADGREISAAQAWFPRLQDASPGQRKHWRLIDKAIGVHWPEIDEDIAVSTIILPHLPTQPNSQISELLPHRWQPDTST